MEVSVEEFWTDDIFYDIIHFQWPEEITGWNNQYTPKIQFLEERIAFLKNKEVNLYIPDIIHVHIIITP